MVSCESSWPLLRGQRSFHLGNRGQDGNSQVEAVIPRVWAITVSAASSDAADSYRLRAGMHDASETQQLPYVPMADGWPTPYPSVTCVGLLGQTSTNDETTCNTP